MADAPRKRRRKPVGSSWRTLAHTHNGEQIEQESDGTSVFDELCIDDWLHLEQMDDRDWWARIGDASLWIHIDGKGNATVTVSRGQYGEVRGWCEGGEKDADA